MHELNRAVAKRVRQLLPRPVKRVLSALISRIGGRFFQRQGIVPYQSETSRCRARLARFCQGYGVDLGFGGDPINETAIRVDYPTPYAKTGTEGVQLGGDARCLFWFADGVLDYVYSSHLLEDFVDTRSVLLEWLRVIKDGGHLILFCPDEQVYRDHCRRTGQNYNFQHKHVDFSLKKVKAILASIGNVVIIHEIELVDIYSWELVAKKTERPGSSDFNPK